MNNDNVAYFHSFGLEYIPKETKKFIGNKNILTNIDQIKGNNLIICGQFCVEFIDFLVKGKSLLDYIN